MIRDVLGVSAQPIACTDVLCFGPPDTTMEELPPGILSPRRIASGVIRGISDYGNKMGIPTVNGAALLAAKLLALSDAQLSQRVVSYQQRFATELAQADEEVMHNG